MSKTELFKENVISFGVKDASDVLEFKFEFNEGVTDDQVEYIVPDCGACTKAKVVKDGVEGTLDLSKASDRRDGYQEGRNPVGRLIIVYLNDGQNQFIPDENKNRKVNQNKRLERLNVSAVVLKE